MWELLQRGQPASVTAPGNHGNFLWGAPPPLPGVQALPLPWQDQWDLCPEAILTPVYHTVPSPTLPLGNCPASWRRLLCWRTLSCVRSDMMRNTQTGGTSCCR